MQSQIVAHLDILVVDLNPTHVCFKSHISIRWMKMRTVHKISKNVQTVRLTWHQKQTTVTVLSSLK